MEGKDLRNAGLKVTLPRLKILEILEGGGARHKSAEDIYKALLNSNEDMFELNRGSHHDHIVCLDCGKVEEFMDDGIEDRQESIAKQHGFEIEDHSMVIYGHCRKVDCPSRATARKVEKP